MNLRRMWHAERRKMIVPVLLAMVMVVHFALPAFANFTHVSTCKTYLDTIPGYGEKQAGIVCAQVVAEGVAHYSGHYKPVIAWGPAAEPSDPPTIIYIDYIIMYRSGHQTTRLDPNQGYTFYPNGQLTLDGVGYDCQPVDNPNVKLATGIRYKLHYWNTPAGTWGPFHNWNSAQFAGGCP